MLAWNDAVSLLILCVFVSGTLADSKLILSSVVSIIFETFKQYCNDNTVYLYPSLQTPIWQDHHDACMVIR